MLRVPPPLAPAARLVARVPSLLVLLLLGCGVAHTAPSEGEALARRYCSSCHAFPEPSLLDRSAWGPVLADMGGRLGVYAGVSRDSLIRRVDAAALDPETIYPTEPVLSEDEWRAISEYVLGEAPGSLDASPREPSVPVGLPDFRVRTPGIRFSPPLTTLAQIQAANGLFFVGNYRPSGGPPGTMLVINAAGEVLFDWALPGVPVAAHWNAGRLFVLLIGPHPAPTDAAAGSLVVLDGPRASPRPLVTRLRRPVHLAAGDLDGDGREDLVVCEYGNERGALSWYRQEPDGSYRRHVLAERPGAIRALLHDFDGDGHTDIGVLFAQGDEAFDVYHGDGDGGFTPRRALRFPPVYGSNHVALADVDGDGIQDLLYTNGDNADVTPILKPYHGVRVFRGQADGTFEEAFFFPLHGATAAAAADIDGDGDLDLAATAYFPDYARTPEESFVLLENTGGLTFTPRTFEDAQRGRWWTLDAGDLDGDGDPDLLLGSNIGFGPRGDRTGLFDRWQREAPSFLVLENTRTPPSR